MAKSIHQILIDLDKGKYLDSGGTDQALKEIEAIIMRNKTIMFMEPVEDSLSRRVVPVVDIMQALYGKDEK